MRPSEMDELFNHLGLRTSIERGRFIGRDERTIRRWMEGTQTVPQEVAMLLRLMTHYHAANAPGFTRLIKRLSSSAVSP